VTADGVKIDEAVGVDVGDDEAELVHVAGEHKDGISLGVQRSESVAKGVFGVDIGGGFYVVIEDCLGFSFIAGGRSSVEQFGKKGGYTVG
jgi:hypothetical protein